MEPGGENPPTPLATPHFTLYSHPTRHASGQGAGASPLGIQDGHLPALRGRVVDAHNEPALVLCCTAGAGHEVRLLERHQQGEVQQGQGSCDTLGPWGESGAAMSGAGVQ